MWLLVPAIMLLEAWNNFLGAMSAPRVCTCNAQFHNSHVTGCRVQTGSRTDGQHDDSSEDP